MSQSAVSRERAWEGGTLLILTLAPLHEITKDMCGWCVVCKRACRKKMRVVCENEMFTSLLQNIVVCGKHCHGESMAEAAHALNDNAGVPS